METDLHQKRMKRQNNHTRYCCRRICNDKPFLLKGKANETDIVVGDALFSCSASSLTRHDAIISPY